jgi:undecaprenyl-diphosphatase
VRHDGKWLVGQHAYNSFPSGHTAAATAFATALWLMHRKRGGVLLFGAAVIAASRIYLRDHHFSDVVAGAFLGVAVALGTRYGFRKRFDEKLR